MATVATDPFVVSDPRHEEAEQLRARMARDGYLFVPGLVNRDAIRRTRHEILAICARAGWLAQGTDPDDGIASPGVRHIAPQPGFMEVYTQVQRLESFHRLAHDPGIVDLVRLIVRDAVLVHPRNIARLIFPEITAYTTPAHQDFIHIKGTPETYTCWFPLGDCPPELGGLAIKPGSHRTGIFQHDPALGAGGRGINTATLGPGWVASPLREGDALLFHSHTVHRGLDNVTPDRLRLSCDFRYQAVSQPVHQSSLAPHHGSLTWEEIYAGWQSKEGQYYWRDLPLTMAER